jgi:hypothetical protein
MKTIKITKEDLDENNFYKYDGIGRWDNYEDANLEIEEGLGIVRFKRGIYVSGSIVAKNNSGIKTNYGIEAGYLIESGLGIEVGLGIKAGLGIKVIEGIKAGYGIESGWSINAGSEIEAGEGIISLYGGIKAGSRIKVNEKCGIVAGIFSNSREKDVEAQEIIGKVVYGNVRLLKSENDEKTNNLSGKVIKIELDGKVYEAVIK